PGAGPRVAGDGGDRQLLQRAERRGAPGGAHPGRGVQAAWVRSEARRALLAGARRHGGPDRPVVARGAPGPPGPGRRAVGEPGLERAVKPGPQASPAAPPRSLISYASVFTEHVSHLRGRAVTERTARCPRSLRLLARTAQPRTTWACRNFSSSTASS